MEGTWLHKLSGRRGAHTQKDQSCYICSIVLSCKATGNSRKPLSFGCGPFSFSVTFLSNTWFWSQADHFCARDPIKPLGAAFSVADL